MVALAAVDPPIEPVERLGHRRHLADVTAGVPVVVPERAVGIGVADGAEVGLLYPDVGEAETFDQSLDVGAGLHEALEGIKMDHGKIRIDCRRHVEEDGGFGAEG